MSDTASVEQRLDAYRAMFSLNGKVALVIGAASGIGKASAEALAALGATVMCADRDEAGAAATAAGIRASGTAEAIRTDAASKDDITALSRAIAQNYGRLDVAVTTPAINIRKTIFDYTDEDFDRIIA